MASVITVNEPAAAAAPEWVKRYPPLITLGIALLIAILVLPSSLNLPQANPATTLELAPVPPTNDKPPPFGNLNQLSLGTSSSLNAGGAQGEGLGGDLPGLPNGGNGGAGRPAATKRCVILDDGHGVKTKHQTEDPLSPPCSPYWDPAADNGG